VTACEWGTINVFDYPLPEEKKERPVARSYAGHSEYVVRAFFSPDGKRLFSVGGEDKAVI